MNANLVKGVLIDLGGVVYQGNAALPGAVGALALLRRSRLPFRFLTNTTSQPIAAILAKLDSLGIEAHREEMFTPSLAARAHIVSHGLDPAFLVSPALKEDFRALPGGARPAVIIGDARDGFTYASLNDAFRRISAGAEFIALAGNRYFADEDGEPSLDVGAFVAALEFASGRKATVLGKPSRDFFHLAVADMGLRPGETAMIGDDAEFDVGAAIKAGLRGYLVHTGKWSPQAMAGLETSPTAEFDNLLAAIRAICGSGEGGEQI